jgi:branched-subunit amino acid transport protein
MNLWVVVAALGVVTILIKAAGPVLLGGWEPPQRARRVLALVSPVVLAALVAVGVLTTGQHYHPDVRLIGLGVAAIALILRAPLLVVVICAVASTALSRALLG